jgi:hypothetical protein
MHDEFLTESPFIVIDWIPDDRWLQALLSAFQLSAAIRKEGPGNHSANLPIARFTTRRSCRFAQALFVAFDNGIAADRGGDEMRGCAEDIRWWGSIAWPQPLE